MARKNPIEKLKDAAMETISTATDVGKGVAGQVSRTAVGLAGEAVGAVRSRVSPEQPSEAPPTSHDGPGRAGAPSEESAAEPSTTPTPATTASKKPAAKKAPAAKKSAAKKASPAKKSAAKKAPAGAAKKTATKKTATPADVAETAGTAGPVPTPTDSPGAKLPAKKTPTNRAPAQRTTAKKAAAKKTATKKTAGTAPEQGPSGPLTDPATAKSVRSEAETLRKAAESPAEQGSDD